VSARRPRARGAEDLGRRGRERKVEEKPGREESWELIKSIAVAVLLFLLIRTFLLQAYTIPSGSMEDTLLVGDYLMANNAIYGAHIPLTGWRTPPFREPRNSDIVVFRPAYNQPVIDVVKRVVGVPGDTLQMVETVLHRNGIALDEAYVEADYLPDVPMPADGFPNFRWHLDLMPPEARRADYAPTRDSWGPVVVPEGHFFLLGDNRDQSLDSRYVGPIPRAEIRGRAIFIYFSYDPHSTRPFPRPVTAARWGRIGKLIR
jgi:signal peptidase I